MYDDSIMDDMYIILCLMLLLNCFDFPGHTWQDRRIMMTHSYAVVTLPT